MGYINHDGRYGRIPYTPDGDHSALWMDNRVGVAAGKYIGRHVLEGEVSYRNRIIDAIYNMDGETLEKGAKYEVR